MEKEIVGVVHASGQRDIDAAVVQRVAGQLDGVERRGAGGVYGEAAAEAQCSSYELWWQPRLEAIAGVDGAWPFAPHLECELHQSRCGITEVAEHDRAPLVGDTDFHARRAEGFPRGMQR